MESRRSGLTQPLGILLGVLLLTAAALAPWAWRRAGWDGIKALIVAGAVCGGANLATWWAAVRWGGPERVNTFLALGFLVRAGVPLAALAGLTWWDRGWLDAGLVWWTLIVYEVLLLTETWIFVRRRS